MLNRKNLIFPIQKVSFIDTYFYIYLDILYGFSNVPSPDANSILEFKVTTGLIPSPKPTIAVEEA